MTIPRFPCENTLENGPQARLLGLYNQRIEGHLLQRLRIPGGRMTLNQWRAVSNAARQWSDTGVLHLTTRQGVEIHGLRSEAIPGLQQALHAAGLTTVGAAGDTPRNITVCPECGLTPGSPDLLPLAGSIQQAINALPCRFDLPRKFKISLSCGSAGCGRPWMNDLGFVLNNDETFRAVVSGSLGVRPGLGILVYESLVGRDVIALTVAAIRLFNAEGDRANRSRARLRHVRETMGDKVFRARLDEYFQEARRESLPEAPVLIACDATDRSLLRLHLPHGHVACQDTMALVDSVDRHGGEIRIGLEHDLLLAGLNAGQLPMAFASMLDAPRIIACPGAHTCTRGIAETWGVAESLRRVLPQQADLLIGISGCPNNCAHAAVSDIGLLGKVKTVNGVKRPHFRLMAGGGHGAAPVLARDLHQAVPADRIAEVVAMLVDSWNDASPDRTLSFSEHIDREWSRLSDQVAEISLFSQE